MASRNRPMIRKWARDMHKRFTVCDENGRCAEGIQFTSGFITLDWGKPDPNHMAWINIDALIDDKPNWRIAWIDAQIVRDGE
jgi:hypothetical protein